MARAKVAAFEPWNDWINSQPFDRHVPMLADELVHHQRRIVVTNNIRLRNFEVVQQIGLVLGNQI